MTIVQSTMHVKEQYTDEQKIFEVLVQCWTKIQDEKLYSSQIRHRLHEVGT